MGRSCRCCGCKTPLLERAFGKPGKSCPRPKQSTAVSVVDKDPASPLQSSPVEDEPQESTKATLTSLRVKSLTTGLKEVQADNQQLGALLTKQSPIKEVSIPTTSTGGATASGVTSLELHAMQGSSQQADRRIAQLGLADLQFLPAQSCIVAIFKGNKFLSIKPIIAIFVANKSGCGILNFALAAGCNHANKSNIALVCRNVPLALLVR